MRYRLRTLLIVLAVWLSAVLGAVAAIAASFPSPDNFRSALAWGTAVSLIPCVGVASYLFENPATRLSTCILFWIATGILSMVSLYVFSMSTVAV